jgi:hypothetical protein
LRTAKSTAKWRWTWRPRHSFSAILKTAATPSVTVQDTATGISASQTGIVAEKSTLPVP